MRPPETPSTRTMLGDIPQMNHKPHALSSGQKQKKPLEYDEVDSRGRYVREEILRKAKQEKTITDSILESLNSGS